MNIFRIFIYAVLGYLVVTRGIEPDSLLAYVVAGTLVLASLVMSMQDSRLKCKIGD